VILAKEKYGLRGREVAEHEAHFIPFSAYTRMSGVDIDGRMLRKGAAGSIANFVKELGGTLPANFDESSDRISRAGGTPLAVADGERALGIVYLKDIVKGGMKERIGQLRAMGIRSVMITGDNPSGPWNLLVMHHRAHLGALQDMAEIADQAVGYIDRRMRQARRRSPSRRAARARAAAAPPP